MAASLPRVATCTRTIATCSVQSDALWPCADARGGILYTNASLICGEKGAGERTDEARALELRALRTVIETSAGRARGEG